MLTFILPKNYYIEFWKKNLVFLKETQMFKIFQLNFNVENRQDLDYLIICHIYKALTFGISLCIQSEACKHID